jgi:hypothetical protein
MRYVDTLLNESYTNQSDNNGTHLRYQVGSGTLTTQNRAQANNNASEILFVYWYSSNFQKHSVISPAILRDRSKYGTNPPAWDNPSTQATYFREPPASVNFATAGHADIISAYNNGTPVNYPDNADQRAECRTDRPVLAFKQGNIYGLIKVENVTSGGGATLSVKVARP